MKAGWQVKALGEVARFTMGQAPAGTDCNKDGNGTPFVKAGEFGDERPIIREWTTDPKKFAKATDVLICVVGATCGKINLGADCAIGRSVAAISPNPQNLDQFFLHYYLEGQVLAFRQGSLGAAQTVVSRDMLAAMEFPLPPLAEQKQIVAVLNAAFAGLSRARAHVLANLENLSHLRQSTLSCAFAGELSTAKDTAPKTGWQIKALGDFSEIRYGYTASAESEAIGPHFLRITDIQNGEVDWEKVPFCRIDEADRPKFSLAIGDIVFARTGATTGKSYLIQDETDAVFASYLIRVRALGNALDGRFLAIYFQTPAYWDAVALGTEGAAQGGFNASKLAELQVPIPPIGEQREIVRQVEVVFERISTTETHYRAKLADLDALRAALLQKAFSGELT